MCPASAKVVDVLAVRLVKQGTETTGFRTGSSLHLCQHVYMQASMIIYIELVPIFLTYLRQRGSLNQSVIFKITILLAKTT